MTRGTIVIAAGLCCALACKAERADAPAKESEPKSEPAPEPAGEPRAEATKVDVEGTLEQGVASAFVETLKRAGLEARAEGPKVSVGEHTLEVDATVENHAVQDGKVVLGVGFVLSVDGRREPALSTGSVGLGDDPADAIESLIREWFVQFGAPITFAFVARELPDQLQPPAQGEGDPTLYDTVELGEQRAFTGLTGVRGDAAKVESVTSEAFIDGLAEAIAPTLPPGPGYHALRVSVVVKGEEVDAGGCRVDGVESPALSQIVSGLDWSAGAPAYMYTQFFVLSRPSE
jgi:hypothetical protein